MNYNHSLYKKLVAHYQDAFGMTNMESRVFALLALDYNRNGFSFDDLIQELNCSKSTLSNTLSKLYESNKITHHCIEGGRKRLFVYNDEFLLLRFNEIKNIVTKEATMMNEVILDQKQKKLTNIKSHTHALYYKKYLDQSSESLSKLLKSLNENLK